MNEKVAFRQPLTEVSTPKKQSNPTGKLVEINVIYERDTLRYII